MYLVSNSGMLPPGLARSAVLLFTYIIVGLVAATVVVIVHSAADALSKRSKRFKLPKERKGCQAVAGRFLFIVVAGGMLLYLGWQVAVLGYNPNPILDPPNRAAVIGQGR